MIKLEIASTFIAWSKTKDALDPLKQHGKTLIALHNAVFSFQEENILNILPPLCICNHPFLLALKYILMYF